MYQCHIVDTKRRLQSRHLIELVKNNAGICIAFDIDNDTHTITVGLIICIGNAFYLLIIYKISNVLN